jgi:hypothetical protein
MSATAFWTTTHSLKTPFAPKNDVAKTLGIEHSCNPVRAPEIGGQSGAFTPKMGGALMPEIDSSRQIDQNINSWRA